MIKRRKCFGNLMQHDVADSVIKGYRGYPPLPHYLVSLFPEKAWLVAGKFLNVTYDIIAINIVYFFSSILFTGVWKINLEGTLDAPTAVTLLYATSPILHPPTPRLLGIGGRTMGNVFCLLYVAILGYAFLSHEYLFYLICIPIGWTIVLSSQFGMQFILFCSFFLSILYLNPVPLGLAIVMLFSGMAIPKLGIKKLLQRKLDHFVWYVRNSSKGTTASNKNKLRDMIRLPVYLFKQPKKFLDLCFMDLTPILAAYSVPPLLIFTYYFIITPFSDIITLFSNNSVVLFLSFLSIATILTFIVTSVRPFLFLGEAERYLEYGASFIYCLFVYYVSKNNINSVIIFYVTVFQVTAILANFLFTELRTTGLKRLRLNSNERFMDMIEFLRGHRGMRILSIPTKLAFKIAIFLDNTDTKFYYDNISKHDKIDGIRYMEEDHVVLSYVKPDMEYFARKYGINILVAQKIALVGSRSLGIDYDFRDQQQVFENEEYIVYKI
jgi:hypothetical protein